MKLWKHTLTAKFFSDIEIRTFSPLSKDVEGFSEFMMRYIKGLPIERAAIDFL